MDKAIARYPQDRQRSAAMPLLHLWQEKFCEIAGIDRKIDPADAGHNPISVSADGNYSIEFVECLASCGTAPVCMIDDDLHENVQPDAANILSNPQSAIRNPPSPHPLEHRLVFKNIGRPDWKTDIDTYIGDGGFEQVKNAVTM